jgi:type VI secretion system protein ImpF
VSKPDYDVRVKPSVLDRLLDPDPTNPRDPVSSRAESVQNLKAAVQRDLEELLNTRSSLQTLLPGFVEVPRSVWAYGLPDFSNLNISSSAGRARLQELIEDAVRHFEPRLTSVSVTLVPREPNERMLRFSVDAKLILQPSPEPVSFNMVMQLNNQEYQVKDIE